MVSYRYLFAAMSCAMLFGSWFGGVVRSLDIQIQCAQKGFARSESFIFDSGALVIDCKARTPTTEQKG